MPPQPQDSQNPEANKKDIDLGKILLPKKEVHAPENAERINAGALLEQETNATLVPPPPAPVVKQPPAEKPSSVQPLQTYQGDIESLVQEKNISVVNIAAAEAGRREAATVDMQQVATSEAGSIVRKIFIVLVGLAFLGAAGGTLAYLFLREPPSAYVLKNPEAPFMFVDATTLVPLPPGALSRDAIMEALMQARTDTSLSLGLMARLYPSATPTSTDSVPVLMNLQTLLSTLSSTIPTEFVRSIDPQYYTLGVHAFDENQAFLVFKIDSYAQAYSGMLGWERTMYNDLLPLFHRTPRPRVVGEEVATTTPPVQILQTTFADRVVENRDARVVQNTSGDILLLWTFLDRETIAITTNNHTLLEIITRFTDVSIAPPF